MKTTIIAALAAAAFLSSSAFAGSITITVAASGANATRTFTIPDAQIGRLANVMKERYGQIDTLAVDGQGKPVVPPVMRDRTNVEALNAWINGFMQGTVDSVKSHEAAKAAKTAADAVAPIAPQ